MTPQTTRKPTFQERLDIICDDQGVSHGRGKLKALAKIMGLTPPRVSQLYSEGDRAKVSVDTINALSKLGYNPRWISMGESPRRLARQIDEETNENNKNETEGCEKVVSKHRETTTTASATILRPEHNLPLHQVAAVVEALCKICGYTLDDIYAARGEQQDRVRAEPSIRTTTDSGVRSSIAAMLNKKSPRKAGNQEGG